MEEASPWEGGAPLRVTQTRGKAPEEVIYTKVRSQKKERESTEGRGEKRGKPCLPDKGPETSSPVAQASS